ncbi:MAG: radical SAM protein [Blastocatellia bacterium]|nr:radical SAM protein [Blastocatellia bacterium]
MKKRILLVSPVIDAAYPNLGIPGLYDKKATMVPLHIATLAAMTAPDFEVDLWDELVHGVITEDTQFQHEYALVGVTGYSLHLKRAKEIAQIFRKKGSLVAIGGPGVTTQPDSCRKDFDIMFLGEAERTWLEFIEDFRAGNYHNVYQEHEFADLSTSPQPKWDSIAHLLKSSYIFGGVQVNRGCPYDCEFCSVWQLLGRKMRIKPIDRVIEEMKTLQKLGMEEIFIVSDNFVGNPRYAKDVLRELIELNATLDIPLSFFAELTITIARDEEMLSLLSQANFSSILIGIESPNLASLKETRKRMNINGDLVSHCKKIGSYGLIIEGSMILGFDNDTPEIFDVQFDFMQRASILIPRINLLKATPGTDLRKRLVSEGRVLDVEKSYGNHAAAFMTANFTTDVIPKNMTIVELLSGYLDLTERLLDWKNYQGRIMGFLSDIRHHKSGQRFDQKAMDALNTSIESLPKNIEQGIKEIISYTQKELPFMLQEVVMRLRRYIFEIGKLPKLQIAVKQQIDMEKSGKVKFAVASK